MAVIPVSHRREVVAVLGNRSRRSRRSQSVGAKVTRTRMHQSEIVSAFVRRHLNRPITVLGKVIGDQPCRRCGRRTGARSQGTATDGSQSRPRTTASWKHNEKTRIFCEVYLRSRRLYSGSTNLRGLIAGVNRIERVPAEDI